MTEKDKEKKNVNETRVKATVIRRRPPKTPEPEPVAAAEVQPKAEAKEAATATAAPMQAPVPPVQAQPIAPVEPATQQPSKQVKQPVSEEKPKPKGEAARPKSKIKAKPGDEKKEALARRAVAKKIREKTPEEILAELQSEEAAERAAEQAAQKAATVTEELTAEKIPAQAAEQVEAVPAAEAKPDAAALKKDVKVFEKEPELKKFFTSRKTGGGRKDKFQGRQQGKSKNQAAQAQARPMKKTEITTPKATKRVIRIVDAISVADLSQRLGVKAGEIIKKLMALGIMATVNQLIDIDSVTLIAQDYEYEVESGAVLEEELMEPGIDSPEEHVSTLTHRAPVVTVMGHVDHGKTSLLDAIRKTNVASGEAGGITQHIGAYHVHLEKGDVTFLDTPGHEAFTAMRARGAKATDIVVLVVAADDGVMPQTIEAINHAKAANVPIIVAINKIDLPQADPARIKQELTQYGLVSEEWGGDTMFVEVSAKKGIKIKELLELLLLQAEVLELKANSNSAARGVVVEAKLDKGRGPVSTVLIQNGTLRIGDAVVSGAHYGRVRAMMSDWGKRTESAGPSMPIEILGLSGVPQAGDTVVVVKDEATAKQIAMMRQRKALEKDRLKTAKISLADLYDKINKGEVKELNLVIKSDVHGSIEAVMETLTKLSTDAVKIKVIHSGVGGISEGDVILASASNAIVVGFNVRPEPKAASLAEKESVDVRLYTIIYNLVDDIKNAMEGMLAPVVREEALGRAEIREVMRLSKAGIVAGCFVTDGKATRGAKVRLIRDSVVIFEGKLSSLKRFKDDVKEVASGYECGMTIEGYNDIKQGDVIEMYTLKEEAAKL